MKIGRKGFNTRKRILKIGDETYIIFEKGNQYLNTFLFLGIHNPWIELMQLKE